MKNRTHHFLTLTILMLAAAFLTAQVDPGTENLVHSYTFEDGTAADVVGGADGTLVGGAAIVDGSLVTTAQDQWMSMPGDVIAMNTLDAVTIEAWFTPTEGANTGWSMLAFFGDTLNGLGSNGYFITTARADDVSRAAISTGDVATPWASETGVNGDEHDDGLLHHMVSTLTATHITLYIDGILLGSAPLAANNKISEISQHVAYLAKGGYGGDPEWIGAIHEFNIYDKALSAGEVLFLWAANPANEIKVVNPGVAQLAHSYTFEDGTAADAVGDADGTLVGGAAIVDGAMVTTAQDQWMSMPGDMIAMDNYMGVTIEAWYTPTAGANTGWSMLAFFGDTLNGLGSNGYFMTTARADDVSRTAISIGDIATPWASETGVNGPEYDDGQLHHMVSTINNMYISFFIDGKLLDIVPLAEHNTISGISRHVAYLAKGGYGGDPEWIGAIDEFNIYNRPLSVSEVLYLYNKQPQRVIPVDPGTNNLVHAYTFEHGAPTDEVGDADGLLVGGAAIVEGQMVTSAQDQWMSMPGDVIAMNTFDEVSIEAWYTPIRDANTGFTMLAFFGDTLNGLGSNGYFMTTARADDKSRTAISIGDVATPWASETGVDGPEYDDGVLHHMVSTINATHISFFIDGVLLGSEPLAANNNIAGISQNVAYLAKGGYGGDPEWIGTIEEFKIYNKALSPGEVLFLSSRKPYKLIPMDPGTENLVHSYSFEYGSAVDMAGDADGLLVGGAAILDGAMVTTAQDQWMSMPGDVIAMDTYDEVTIEAWYTPAAGANAGWSMLAFFGDTLNGLGSNGYFMTTARADDVSRTAISTGDIATPWASETGVNGPEYDDGLLHHMVSTLTGTDITFYIDGMPLGSAPLAANNKISEISQHVAYLAKGGYGGDPEWIGAIEEFNIYNKALSEAEVVFLWNRKPFKVVPMDPGTDNLLHSYTFDDGTAADGVGDADGTLVGGAAIVGGSLVTTAQDQWMSMPGDVIAMDTYDEVTIEAWYTPTEGGNAGWSMLAFFGDTLNGLGSNGYFITTARADDKSRAAISTGDIATPWASETGVDGPEFDDGLLHHMVSTLTGTDITLYIDGVLMGSAPLAANNKISEISEHVAYLAKGGYGGDPEWIGAIHAFNIYNKALSAGEVLYLWNERMPVGVEQEDELAGLPREYTLSQNYPNPFNPRTKIVFSLPERSKVKLVIYDILGKQVAVLVDDVKEAGYYRAEFDGSRVASGMYLYVLKAGDRVISRKMLLTK